MCSAHSFVHAHTCLQGYDQTIIPMVIIMILIGLGIIIGGVGLIIFQAGTQFYARPLSYHLDVERKY